MSQLKASEKFKQSRFWREYQEFRRCDVATFCNISAETAFQIVHALRDELDKFKVKGSTMYRRSGGARLLKRKWREPLPFDGDYTPRWY